MDSAIEQLFVNKAKSADDCYRCGGLLRAAGTHAKAAKQYKKMTGRTFPSSGGISLNVAADARTLGVVAYGRGTFCCACAVAYMTEFNRLNTLRRAN